MELLGRARRGDLDGVKRLIELLRYDVNITNSCNQTALYLACENGYTKVAQYLLESGASVDLGAKPLIAAVRNKDYDCVKLLLQHNAYVNCNMKGESPMSVARQKRHYSVILLLLQYGAVPPASLGDDDDAVQLLKSASDEHAQAIEKLIKDKTINLTSESTFLAAFSCAFKCGSVELAERMLSSDSYSKTEQLYPEAAYYSAKNNWPTILSKLLAKGVDINLLTDGYTPLYVACKEGHKAVVNLLLNSGADPNVLNKHTAASSSLAICCALKKGHIDIVYMLLKSGANVNNKDQFGKSAWIYFVELLASQWCKKASDILDKETLLNMLKSMLLAGGDVNELSTWREGLNALHIASSFGKCDVMMELIQHGADCKYVTASGKSALDFACENGHEVAVELLLKNGADPDRKYTGWDRARYVSYGAKPVICTSAKNDSETMVKLLLKYGADVNASDEQGNTALHLTTSSVIVETLLNAGANVNAVNHNTQAALSVIFDKLFLRSVLSSTTADASAAEILLSAGADAYVMDKNGASLLYLACKRGMTEFVKLFLSHVASPNTGTANKYPIFAACKGHHYDSLKLLLEYNADVTVRDKNGKTCLHRVLESRSHHRSHDDKRSDLVQLLLDKGADTNTSSKDGETPFYVACSSGLQSIAAKMLKCGAKANGDIGQKLPLVAACNNNHIPVVLLLLFNGADPNTFEHDLTIIRDVDIAPTILPLHVAAAGENIKLVELLLKHGANVDVRDNGGNTALHHVLEQCERHVVVSSNAKSALDILLENKAYVNIANRRGETPLYRAASRQLPDVVRKMLEKYGGNPNTGSPLVAACLVGNEELVEMLLKHGADPNMASTVYIPYSKQQKLPLFAALEQNYTHIISLLLNAGANVNMANHEGRNTVCFVAELLTNRIYYSSTEEITKKVPMILLLLQHGANFNMLMPPHGLSPLYLVVTAIKEASRRKNRKRLTLVVELLQLMVKHGAMLLDSVCLKDSEISRMQSLNSGTLKTLSTFDDKHEFIVDLLRAGAGFQVIAACCDALATSTRKATPQRCSTREAKSIRLCQAVVLAGYSPSTEELQNLQVAAAGETEAGGVLEQLLNWLNEDKQQVPSLLRQCRIAIRRQLSEAVHYQTIIPAIDKLPLPNDVKLYLQFAGKRTEVDLSINKELLTTEETSIAEKCQLLSPYNSEESDFDFSDLEYYDYYDDD